MYDYNYYLISYKSNINNKQNTLSKDVLNKIYELQNQETIQQES